MEEISYDNTPERNNKISKILDKIKGIKHNYIETDHEFNIKTKIWFKPVEIYIKNNDEKV